MTWKGATANLIGAIITGVAVGQMIVLGYPWGYPVAVIIGVILMTLGNWESVRGRAQVYQEMQQEVDGLKKHVGSVIQSLPAPQGPPGEPGSDPLGQAREGAITAIAKLFMAWRGVNMKGWMQDFIDEALNPALEAAMRRVGQVRMGTERKVGAPAQEKEDMGS